MNAPRKGSGACLAGGGWLVTVAGTAVVETAAVVAAGAAVVVVGATVAGGTPVLVVGTAVVAGAAVVAGGDVVAGPVVVVGAGAVVVAGVGNSATWVEPRVGDRQCQQRDECRPEPRTLHGTEGR
tara:strand:- start:32 stop:406 length:375 start_codon:yes stop_codon:yes gene_type:complete